jgi:pimeloyl-ACP methyl ester carboxylesterase
MTTKQFLYKNTKISFSDSGKGNTIVLLHGYLENRTMWNCFIPKFTQENRVLAIDLLGHGQTDCLGYIHTIEDQAEMVFAVLKHLNIEKVILIGHSMGGYIALAFAEKYPKMMSKLVLLNSTAYEDSDERKTNRDRAIKMVKRDYTSFVRLSISNLFSEQNRELLTDEIENIKLEALKTPLQGIIAALEGMKIRKNRLEVIQKAKYAILLVLSKKDPVLDYEEHKKQVENTKIKLATLEAGHMSHIENKNEVEKILLEFVN